MPAAFCGIVGLKPTWGLVPYTGIISHGSPIDHVGPMGKTVMICAQLLEVIAGGDGIDNRQPHSLRHRSIRYVEKIKKQICLAQPLQNIRIGILKEGFDDPHQNAEIASVVHQAIRRFPNIGATVTTISIPEHKAFAEVWMCAFPTFSLTQGVQGNIIGSKELALTNLYASSSGNISQQMYYKLGSGGQNAILRGLYLQEKYGPELTARL